MDAETAYYRALELRERGELPGLRKLFRSASDELKGNVLNALTDEPGTKPEMGPGIVALAIEGAVSPAAMTRSWACDVFMNQCDWGVDMTLAVGPVLGLLRDHDNDDQRTVAYATGIICKRKFDWSDHLVQLNRLLVDKNLYVSEAAVWALAQMSRSKQDINFAVPNLVKVLVKKRDYDEPRKEACKAMLHHARKSVANRDLLRQAVKLNDQWKVVKRFLDQLGQL